MPTRAEVYTASDTERAYQDNLARKITTTAVRTMEAFGAPTR